MVSGALMTLRKGESGSMGCWRLGCTGWLVTAGVVTRCGGGWLPLRLVQALISLTLEMCVLGLRPFLRRVFKCVPQDAIVVEVGVGGHYSAPAESRVRECPTDEINAGVGRRAVSSGRG